VGLGGRVAALVAAVLAVGAGAVGLLSYSAAEAGLLERIDRGLEERAGSLIAEATARQTTGVSTVAPDADLARLVAATQDQRVPVFKVKQVLDAGGRPIAATIAGALPVTERDRQLASDGAGAALVSADGAGGVPYRVLTVGVPGGALQVAEDLTDTNDLLGDLRRKSVLVVALVTLVGASVGWLGAVGMTMRIRRITTVAGEVSRSGDLNAVVPTSGRDEAGRLGRAVDRLLHSQAEAQHQQQRLVEDAGHELRTPLASLRTNLDVLQRHPDLPQDLRGELLGDLDRDLLELAFLMEGLVELAAHGPDEPRVRPERVEPLALFVAERMQRRTGRTITVHADQSVVMVDYTALERAVTNLVENAVKFDTAGGPVEIHVDKGRIWVADRGPGIPGDDLNRIFNRFHRAPEARGQPGSGLGLAIVARIAADHAGSVFARNRSGGGSAVGLSLPLANLGDGQTAGLGGRPGDDGASSPDSHPPGSPP